MFFLLEKLHDELMELECADAGLVKKKKKKKKKGLSAKVITRAAVVEVVNIQRCNSSTAHG